MILVGYPTTGGYKLYKAINKIILIISDVIFDEVRGWQQVVTDYLPLVIDYHNTGIVHVVF